jgi:hypothetical protein
MNLFGFFSIQSIEGDVIPLMVIPKASAILKISLFQCCSMKLTSFSV